MEFLKDIFSLFIFQPLFNLMVILYNLIPDLGVVIVVLTLLIRFLLLPVSKKSIESQKKLQEIQPEIEKIKKEYKNDRQQQGLKMMELYKKNNINPASGCLPLIIQIVFLIALYRVFMLGIGFNGESSLFYSFVSNPGKLNNIAFGFLDLSKVNVPLAFLAAILQFVQSKMMLAAVPQKPKEESSEEDFSALMQKQMVYMSPILTLIIGIKFPSGLVVYWIVTTLFMIAQQYFVMKEKKSGLSNPERPA